jgi:hypothetical protein
LVEITTELFPEQSLRFLERMVGCMFP